MKTTFAVIIAFSMLNNATIGTAADTVSIERGKVLFESTKLGKSGKSCATCHPGGKKLEWAGTFDDEKLEEITNRCIQKALQGQPLKEGSDDLKSLIMYLKTFAGPN
jgi:hypothetical protein